MTRDKGLDDVTFGEVTVRPMMNDAVIKGEVIKFTPREVEILAELARAKGKPVGKGRIGRTLWNEANRRDKPVSPNRLIHVFICRLRKRLKNTAASIETLHQWDVPVHARGKAPCGYRLVVED